MRRATSTLQTISTTVSGWYQRRPASSQQWQAMESLVFRVTAGWRSMLSLITPLAWRSTRRAISLSPIQATIVFAK